MSNLAIIPARGGSKRIPRKNIKSFLGKPIIEYSIECALNSDLFDEVIVSTDDDEVVEIAKKCGAKVPFIRSKKNSDDFATTADVIEEVLFSYADQGKSFERASCIYATSPLIDVNVLKESYEILKRGAYDTVFPVVLYSHPINRAIRVVDGKMSMFFEDYKEVRSQDLEKSYYDAGQFYTFVTEKFLKNRQLWTDNAGTIELEETAVQDIDSITDWRLAELKYQLINKI